MGRFSRGLGLLRGLLAFIVLFYLLLVAGSYGWLTRMAPAVLPQGAGFAFSTAPLGIALDIPEARVDVGYGTAEGRPLVLRNVRHVWPLLTPWRMQTTAESAALHIHGVVEQDRLDGHGVTLQMRLPLTFELTFASIDWRIVANSIRGDGAAQDVESVDATTFVSPRLMYSENLLHRVPMVGAALVGTIGGPAQVAELSVSPVMLPTSAVSSVVQMDNFKFRLISTVPLPHSTERAAVAGWRAAGGQLSLEDFTLSVIGIDLLLAGDVNLSDKLDLTGNMQMQVSGVGEGYSRLGQLNIIPPQQYRLLGYLLQAAPDAGAKTFTLPVKIEKNKVYIGPAAAFNLGVLPWQVTNALLDTPVAPVPTETVPVEPVAVAPQMTPVPPGAPPSVPPSVPPSQPSSPVR